MLRTGVVLAVLLCACGDLTRVPPPPVPLSAIGSVQAAAGGALLHAGSQGAVRLARAVAPNALLTLHLPDIGGMIERFRKTGLYRLLNSPQMREVLGEDFAYFNLSPGSAPGFDSARLMRALKGEAIVALQKLSFSDDSPAPDVSALAGISVRGAEREAEQLVEMLGMIAANQPEVTVEKGTVQATSFSRLVGKTPWPWVVEVAVYRDALLIGYGHETVTAAVARLLDEEAQTLAEDPAYLAAMRRSADPRDAVRITVNLGEAWKQYNRYLPADGRQAIEALGLDKVRGFATSVRFEDADIVVSSFIDSPGGKDFFTQLLRAHPVDRQFLKRVPANARSFSLFSIDGARILAKVREALPAEARKEIATGLERMRRSGLDLEKDVFEIFGPRCAVVGVPYERHVLDPMDAIFNQLLGSALVVELQDPEQAQAVLEKLPRGNADVRRREFVVEGTHAVAYHFDGNELPDELAVSYALSDGYLIVAATEETLKQMLRPRSPDTAKRYHAALEDAPETVAVLSYDDMRSGPDIQMQMMVAGLMHGLSRGAGGPRPDAMRALRGAGLPDLGYSVSYTVADDNGVFSFTRSPTGGIGSTGGVAGLAIIAAIAIPNLVSARLNANESATIATMRSVQMAQETFRAQGYRDADSDGDGEYGFLGELLGRRRPGEKRSRNQRSLLGTGFRRQDNDWVRSGYYYRTYLPSEDGSPVGGHEKSSRLAQVDGDLAESIMIVVAWPMRKGTSGNRAFLLDAAGNLFACADGGYGDRNSPPPDILSSQKGNLASEPLRPGAETRDGARWVRLRD